MFLLANHVKIVSIILSEIGQILPTMGWDGKMNDSRYDDLKLEQITKEKINHCSYIVLLDDCLACMANY